MTSVVLKQELHANTRRTRLTYRGTVDGRPAAIKCYRRPLFGLFHWLRAQYRGRRLRAAGAAVPGLVYSGWFAAERCFCFATAFLENYRSLRAVLTEEPSRTRQLALVAVLGRSLADAHNKGILQPDCNLTNFMLGDNDVLAFVDEDDIRVYRAGLSPARARLNLANVAARLPDEEMVATLLAAYLGARPAGVGAGWDPVRFRAAIAHWERRLAHKRAQRNITEQRRFD
ncbi:hypothetical protein Q6D67_01330 [Haliea sp. E1-2-M8]|uniref:hypothetical protein n=1 Tax=Haliea sp. E1-2-M8 TaxID=3064706 RepID=UPI002715B018|nr:hypothetical protein [Haliea sp. E1-2-M8]MDO8860326.1 hypothetical protein [Haliea sp. E1-2-M8]